MTFEELKIRIQGEDSVLLKCKPKFVIKQMNLHKGLECNTDIILIAKLFYNDNYTVNHVPVQGDIIGGGIYFHPKLNPQLSCDDTQYICTKGGNGEFGQAVMMVHTDEDCADIEVLNLCEGNNCGI